MSDYREAPPATVSLDPGQPECESSNGATDHHEYPAAQRRSAFSNGAMGESPARKCLKKPSIQLNEDDGKQVRETTARLDRGTSEWPTRSQVKGRLWTEGEPPRPRKSATAPASYTPEESDPRPRRQHGTRSTCAQSTEEHIQSPSTRPISQEQLVAEVKGIYAGLVMVESKCIEVETAQQAPAETTSKLNNEQWQALMTLHRTLLHEHHDFFLASRHPLASRALRHLAQKYAMPARVWRHGIHSFSELLRHRLPDSLEHMSTFVYLAYSMMALLNETVPAFEDTWIECLGDLGRYRMAIEDEDIRDREIWAGVSRSWYSKSQPPRTGRLHHHLAILARPNAVQQLFYYTKSLCVAVPFKSARDNILSLFNPILGDFPKPPDFNSVKPHGIGFAVSGIDKQGSSPPDTYEDLLLEYDKSKIDFLHLLDDGFGRNVSAQFVQRPARQMKTQVLADISYYLQPAPPRWSDPSLTEEGTIPSWLEPGMPWASVATNLNVWPRVDWTLSRLLLAEQEFPDDWFNVLIEDDGMPSIDDYELFSGFERYLELQMVRTWWFAMRYSVCHEHGPPGEPSSYFPVKKFPDDNEHPPRSNIPPDRGAQHSLLIYCKETMSLSRSILSRFASRFAARILPRHGMATCLAPRTVVT